MALFHLALQQVPPRPHPRYRRAQGTEKICKSKDLKLTHEGAVYLLETSLHIPSNQIR